MTFESLEKLKSYDFYRKLTVSKNDVLKTIRIKFGEFLDIPDGITIVLVTYKRLNLLKDALESLINQNGNYNFQVIVIDNEGISSKATPVEDYIKGLNDKRIIYVQQDEKSIIEEKKDFSVYDAGFVLARTKWATLMHDDDMLHPEYISIMSEIVKNIPDLDAVCCGLFPFSEKKDIYDTLTVDDSEIEIVRFDETEFQDGFPRQMLGTLIRRDVYLDIGFYSYEKIDDIGKIADCMFMVRLAHYYRTYFFNNKLYRYRRANTSASFSSTNWDNTLVCRKQLLEFLAKKRNPIIRNVMIENARINSALEIERLDDPLSNGYSKKLVKDKKRIYEECNLDLCMYKYNSLRTKMVRCITRIVQKIKEKGRKNYRFCLKYNI